MKAYRKIIYQGRVQGVGFRYSVKRIASGYEVIGTVRNLPDGSVELKVGGGREEVDGFLEAIARSHLSGHIKETAGSELEAFPDSVKGFEIQT